MQLSNDLELVARSRNGDTQALSVLFERHYRSSVRVARRILRSEDEALDAVQSAYLSAFQHFDAYRAEATFSTWITRIVKNQCFGYLRGPEQRRDFVDVEGEGVWHTFKAGANGEPSPEELASYHEFASALSDVAERLPKQLHDVYFLCCISGFSAKEAAAKLGLTLPAAKVRLFRARLRVRSDLDRRLAKRAKTNGVNHLSHLSSSTRERHLAPGRA